MGTLVLPNTGFAMGDDSIPNHVTTALNPRTQAAIDSGALHVNEYTGTNRMGTKGASDGNPIAVRIDDRASAEVIGIRLRHEWFHCKHGQAYGPYNGGVLFPCDHFQAWADSYDQYAYVSCERPGSVNCNQAMNAIKKMEQYYLACVTSGRNATWPTNPPPLCCD